MKKQSNIAIGAPWYKLIGSMFVILGYFYFKLIKNLIYFTELVFGILKWRMLIRTANFLFFFLLTHIFYNLEIKNWLKFNIKNVKLNV